MEAEVIDVQQIDFGKLFQERRTIGLCVMTREFLDQPGQSMGTHRAVGATGRMCERKMPCATRSASSGWRLRLNCSVSTVATAGAIASARASKRSIVVSITARWFAGRCASSVERAPRLNRRRCEARSWRFAKISTMCGHAHRHTLTDVLVGHGVVRVLDLDVIVGMDFGALPLCVLVGPRGKHLERRLVQFEEARAS